MSKVYLAGPILGQTYEQARFGWRKEVADKFDPGIEPLSPMRQEGHLAELPGKITDQKVDGFNHIFSHGQMIFQKDLLDIKMADIVLVNLLGAKKVSKGTLVEIGLAFAFGKTIIVVMEPEGNIHDHPFVRQPAMVVGTLDEAVLIINAMLSTGV